MVENLYFVLIVTNNKISCIELHYTLYKYELPEPGVQNSAQSKMESETVNEYGHVMDEPYQCIHCHLIRTQASQNQTMMKVKKHMVIQLKIFDYDQVSKDFSKTLPITRW